VTWTDPTTTRAFFTLLLAAVVIQRLLELRLSARNRRWLVARGAREAGAGHYPWMVALHSLFLASCLAEVWLLERPFQPVLAAAMGAILLAATTLRYWAITSLGHRWTARVLVLPGAPRVITGPYRYLRHPNYLAVQLEIAALPLVHAAWLTTVGFSVANAILLAVRIGVEERALHGASEKGGR
jgi:methyltransferase